MISLEKFNEISARANELIESELLTDIKHLSNKTAENLCDLPIILHKYLVEHKNLSRYLYELDQAVEEKVASLTVYYKEDYVDNILKDREVTQYIKTDEEYRSYSKMKNELKALVDSFEKAIAILRDINWVLKNRLDYQRLNQTEL